MDTVLSTLMYSTLTEAASVCIICNHHMQNGFLYATHLFHGLVEVPGAWHDLGTLQHFQERLDRGNSGCAQGLQAVKDMALL
jgi:hypothetical protein